MRPRNTRDTVSIRLSPEELEQLRVAAKGKPLSTWVRAVALERAEMDELVDRMREDA